MRERIEWLIEAGIHGFSTQLSAGEFAYLGLDERRSLTQVVVEAVNGRAPVLVGISGNSLAESTELARHAGELGAAAAMLMPRSYFKLTEDEVVAYYEAVGDQAGCPLGIYNNPVTTGVDISADLYARIQGVCNVVVTKDGAGDVFRVSEVRARCPRTMAYLCGTEYQSLPALVLGADGCCNAINSVAPEQVVAIYDAVQAGDLAAAREALREAPAAIHVHPGARRRTDHEGGRRAARRFLRTAPPSAQGAVRGRRGEACAGAARSRRAHASRAGANLLGARPRAVDYTDVQVDLTKKLPLTTIRS
jgi:dihydrodipicolinate synthase/N-acetylneuraminate lyase